MIVILKYVVGIESSRFLRFVKIAPISAVFLMFVPYRRFLGVESGANLIAKDRVFRGISFDISVKNGPSFLWQRHNLAGIWQKIHPRLFSGLVKKRRFLLGNPQT